MAQLLQVLLARGSSMYVGYFGGWVWVANDDDSDNDDDDDDGGSGGGSCGTKLLLAVFSLQSSHGDHFKETGGPCCQRWAFYNVRLRHWPSTRTKKELKNQKNGLQQQQCCSFQEGQDKGAGLAEIAKRSTRKAGGKWPKLALSKSDNNHAWVLTLTHILPHTHTHTYNCAALAEGSGFGNENAWYLLQASPACRDGRWST